MNTDTCQRGHFDRIPLRPFLSECWISTNGHFLESSALDAAFGAWGPYVVYKNYYEDARTFFFNNAQLNVNPPDGMTESEEQAVSDC